MSGAEAQPANSIRHKSRHIFKVFMGCPFLRLT